MAPLFGGWALKNPLQVFWAVVMGEIIGLVATGELQERCRRRAAAAATTAAGLAALAKATDVPAALKPLRSSYGTLCVGEHR